MILAAGAIVAVSFGWIVHPYNQLGVTRPSTLTAGAAIGLGLLGTLIGAVETRREPRSAAVAVMLNMLAVLAAVALLGFMMTLPYGQ